MAENRRILFDALGAPDASVIQPRQIHGDRVVVCDARDGAASCQADADEGADGVVVRANDVAALLCFADCVPVIAVAPTGSFSVVHAGWRGVAARIVEKAVAMLCSAEGISPSLVDVYIGPHIRQCHFEVGDDLAARFSDAFGADTVSGRFVDLSAALKRSLAACGVDERRIADAGACTVCDGGKRYYSYRASGGTCGRHAAVAVRVSEQGRSGASCLSNSAMPQ